MARVEVCLVSEQPIPNLVPVLDPALRPDRVILMQSPDMAERALWLKAVLERSGCQVDLRPIEPWNIFAARTAVEAAVAAAGAAEVRLNATGGTKIMAFAALSVFQAQGRPVIYVDTQSGLLRFLHADLQPLPLPDILGVRDYLESYGYRVTGAGSLTVASHWLDLTENLVAEVEALAESLVGLNRLAGRAKDTKTLSAEVPAGERTASLDSLLASFAGAGLLALQGGKVRFTSEEARAFVGGGWLERYVYEIVRTLVADGLVKDAHLGLQVQSAKAVPNELDVAFTARNRLHLIECKAKANVGREPVYRLDSLRDVVGGLYSRALLVSYRGLPGHVAERCRDLRIQTVAGSELKHLKERLRQWLKT